MKFNIESYIRQNISTIIMFSIFIVQLRAKTEQGAELYMNYCTYRMLSKVRMDGSC